MKLLDQYYNEFRSYCLESYKTIKQTYGEPDKFVVNWPDGPFTTRLFNLGYYAKIGDKIIDPVGDSDPYYEGYYSLPVQADLEGIKTMYKKYPAMKGFFINLIDSEEWDEEDEDYIPDLKNWFKGKEIEDEDMLGGLEFPQNPYGDPIGEFDNIMYQLLTDHQKRVIDEIKKGEAKECKYFAAEGHDGGGYFSLDSDEILEWRSYNKYQPSIEFLEEYILLFTDDKTYAKQWAKRIAKLKF